MATRNALRDVFIAICLMIVGAVFGSNAALDGVARDCQKQTFFKVSKVKFECMEWKPEVMYSLPSRIEPISPPR